MIFWRLLIPSACSAPSPPPPPPSAPAPRVIGRFFDWLTYPVSVLFVVWAAACDTLNYLCYCPVDNHGKTFGNIICLYMYRTSLVFLKITAEMWDYEYPPLLFYPFPSPFHLPLISLLLFFIFFFLLLFYFLLLLLLLFLLLFFFFFFIIIIIAIFFFIILFFFCSYSSFFLFVSPLSYHFAVACIIFVVPLSFCNRFCTDIHRTSPPPSPFFVFQLQVLPLLIFLLHYK